jgi:hypothetical protein
MITKQAAERLRHNLQVHPEPAKKGDSPKSPPATSPAQAQVQPPVAVLTAHELRELIYDILAEAAPRRAEFSPPLECAVPDPPKIAPVDLAFHLAFERLHLCEMGLRKLEHRLRPVLASEKKTDPTDAKVPATSPSPGSSQVTTGLGDISANIGRLTDRLHRILHRLELPEANDTVDGEGSQGCQTIAER